MKRQNNRDSWIVPASPETHQGGNRDSPQPTGAEDGVTRDRYCSKIKAQGVRGNSKAKRKAQSQTAKIPHPNGELCLGTCYNLCSKNFLGVNIFRWNGRISRSRRSLSLAFPLSIRGWSACLFFGQTGSEGTTLLPEICKKSFSLMLQSLNRNQQITFTVLILQRNWITWLTNVTFPDKQVTTNGSSKKPTLGLEL